MHGRVVKVRGTKHSDYASTLFSSYTSHPFKAAANGGLTLRPREIAEPEIVLLPFHLSHRKLGSETHFRSFTSGIDIKATLTPRWSHLALTSALEGPRF